MVKLPVLVPFGTNFVQPKSGASVFQIAARKRHRTVRRHWQLQMRNEKVRVNQSVDRQIGSVSRLRESVYVWYRGD
jgi:hypothetical protein